ncbi:hypothetical protein NQZ68_016809 [Dissostichus eleginoides]|nr:hypothetical protein NQZ68_016809 [Dissostichus eleginoides]
MGEPRAPLPKLRRRALCCLETVNKVRGGKVKRADSPASPPPPPPSASLHLSTPPSASLHLSPPLSTSLHRKLLLLSRQASQLRQTPELILDQMSAMHWEARRRQSALERRTARDKQQAGLETMEVRSGAEGQCPHCQGSLKTPVNHSAKVPNRYSYTQQW